MAATAPPQGNTEVIIGRQIPPDADFVFTSTDAHGSEGELNRYVAQETKHGALPLDEKELAEGFAVIRREGYPTVVAVVTVASRQPTRRLLGGNLQRAFRAVASEFADRSVWIPLMGAGMGALPPSESLEMTLLALRTENIVDKAVPTQIALSVGPEVDDDTMMALAESAHEQFGDRLKILDPIAERLAGTNGGGDTIAQKAADIPSVPPIEIELTGDLVQQVQKALVGAGHRLVIDGSMGRATRAAISAYQSANDMEPTGIVTLDLLERLGLPGPRMSVEESIAQATIRSADEEDTGDDTDPERGTGENGNGDGGGGGGDAKEAGGSQPPPGETAPFYPDHPAREDALGREAIAEAIATIVRDAWSVSDERRGENVDRTFMVHIHGRWGSGKSSILNFLRDILRPNAKAAQDAASKDETADAAGTRAGEPWLRRTWRNTGLLLRDLPRLIRHRPPADTDGEADADWIVVDYNAWRNQGHGPAWWTLLNRVHTEAFDQLGGIASARARSLYWGDIAWRLRSGWLPYVIIAITAVLLILLTSWVLEDVDFGDALKVCATVLTVVGGIFAFGKAYRIGSARTASTFLELTRDPLRPLTHRYEEMIDEIGRPVAVFIDDLDRCDAEFVVELLQSVQTLYRRARVLYVVAADRDWICCSYEQVYDKFQEPIGEAGRPLGHLFLEKIFQLSISVPNISGPAREEYWQRLVAGTLTTGEAEAEDIRAQEEAAIEKLDTEADIRDYTEQIKGDPVRRRIAGAAAFSRLQSARLRTEREHFLTRYADLIEPNPRAMKRLVNAYGFKRGFELMSGAATDADALVRWTVLELRWPTLAAHLARSPDDIEMAADDAEKSEDETVKLLAEGAVRRVSSGLSPTAVRILVGDGTVEEDNAPTAA